MKKRVLFSWLLVLLILGTSVMPAMASAPAGEKTSPVPETQAEAEAETQAEAEAETQAEAQKEIPADIPEIETLKEYLELIMAIAVSEEFQDLMKYEEVQELVKEVLCRIIQFAYEDRDLTEEILRTAGVNDTGIQLVMLLVDATKGEEDKILEIIENVNVQDFMALQQNHQEEETLPR